MMRLSACGIFLVLAATFALPASACKFVLPETVTIDRALAHRGERKPKAPLVRVVSIERGSAAGHSCASSGVLRLAIATTKRDAGAVYTFRVIRGGKGRSFVQDGPLTGTLEDGTMAFLFPFDDGATARQEPLDFVIRVTALTRSGRRGGRTDLRVTDPGRL
jgi:hypothetical protein